MPSEHILHTIIASVDRMTPLPRIASRALQLAASSEVDIVELVAVVQFDPVITSKCLQLCNSSYFWIKEEVTSLHRAVVILGTQNIVKIILTHCLKTPEYKGPHAGYKMAAGELWRHSVSSAVLSGLLAEAAGQPVDAALFTAALLHDIGKLVLNPFMEAQASEMAALLGEGHSVIAAEKALFEIDHAELGGMIAAGWNLPDILTTSIRDHHSVLSNSTRPGPAAWVRLTNLVAHLCAFNTVCDGADEVECGIKPSILSGFGLNSEAMAGVLQAHHKEMSLITARL